MSRLSGLRMRNRTVKCCLELLIWFRKHIVFWSDIYVLLLTVYIPSIFNYHFPDEPGVVVAPLIFFFRLLCERTFGSKWRSFFYWSDVIPVTQPLKEAHSKLVSWPRLFILYGILDIDNAGVVYMLHVQCGGDECDERDGECWDASVGEHQRHGHRQCWSSWHEFSLSFIHGSTTDW